MRFTKTLILATLIGAVGTPVGAQERDTWNWSGTIGEGRRVYVHNVNGAVRLEAGTGNTVEVTAVKRWRRGDPEDVRIEARMTSGGNGDVIVCALWGERSTCDEDGISTRREESRWRNNDVSVEFTVRVPAHARVTARTVNGDVRVAEVRGDVEARTVNGDIEARSTAGRVDARTTNGSITVAGAITGDGVEYRTVNGSITIELPADAKADVELRTVNGRISTDFPITFDGTINPRRINAAIGGGGPRLTASTTNGSIRLRKR